MNPYSKRGVRVDREMIDSGSWNKVAKKTYKHISGVVIRYDYNAWLWEIVGGKFDGERYERLWPARDRVEQA